MDNKIKQALENSVKTIRELKQKVNRLQADRLEDIAVVGTACRLPGGVENAEDFWALLASGASAIGEDNDGRWSAERFVDSDYDADGKMVTPYGGWLKDVYDFDAGFFGMSALEAENLDPQHRLLFEQSWYAFEDAGIDLARLKGSDTGVFIGIGSNDYGIALMSEATQVNAYVASGNALAMAAGRLSHFYDFTGPALSVDTACSSSLVAVAQACQALSSGQSQYALVAGVNCILTPNASINFSRARMLSTSAQAYVFDERASGYIRGEGCIAIVLCRLSHAEQSGHSIYGLVKGCAVNHDGHAGGVTVPNGPAQEKAVLSAIKKAGVAPEQIDYIEAHGTGTSLGDPIEANALGKVFATSTRNRPLYVGAVKENLGHLEAAAGLAGLLKTLLVLKKRQVPAQPGFNRLNHKIHWAQDKLRIAKTLQPLTSESEVLYGGVSSFGFSGTNAHVVLSSYQAKNEASEHPLSGEQLLLLSAKKPGSLKALAASVAEQLVRSDSKNASALCAAAANRTHLSERLAVIGGDGAELAEKLRGIADEPGEQSGERRWTLVLNADESHESVLSMLPQLALDNDATKQTIEQRIESLNRNDCFARHQCILDCLERLSLYPDVVVGIGCDVNLLSRPESAAEYLLTDSHSIRICDHSEGMVDRSGETELLQQDRVVLAFAELPRSIGGVSFVLNCRAQWLKALGLLYVRGLDIQWQRLYRQSAVRLPHYPFERSRYCSAQLARFIAGSAQAKGSVRPGISLSQSLPDGKVFAEIAFDSPAFDLMAQHQVYGRRFVPASTQLYLLYGEVMQLLGAEALRFEQVSFNAPVNLDGDELQWFIQIDKAAAKAAIYSRKQVAGDESFTCHVEVGYTAIDSVADYVDEALVSSFDNGSSRGLDIQDLYRRSSASGIELGDAFKGLTGLLVLDDRAKGDIDVAAYAGAQPLQHWTLALDACFQSTAALRRAEGATYLLAGLDRVTVYHDISPQCVVYTHRLESDSETELKFELLVCNLQGRILCKVDNARFKLLGEQVRASCAKEDSYYAQQWRDSGKCLRDFDCSVRVAGALQGLVQDAYIDIDNGDAWTLSERFKLSHYLAFRRQIEQYCLAYIVEAFAGLGWYSSWEHLPLHSLIERLNIVPSQHSLFGYLLKACASAGCLTGDESTGYRLGEGISVVETGSKLRSDYAQYDGETDFIDRCGSALSDVLCGRQDPLTVLFRGDGLSGAEAIYLESPIAVVLNRQVAQLLATLSKRNQVVRILEVGAGTGGTTTSILPLLAKFGNVRYCYTDISPLFLDRAKEKFVDYDFIDYRLYNAEQPCREQGLVPDSFDIVIAANVIHATRSLRQTCTHIHELLKPDGVFVLRECVVPQLSADISFGMTEGWWRFEDSDVRPDYVLLDCAQWQSLLGQCGYVECVAALPEGDAAEALVVSRARKTSVESPHWLVIHSGQSAAEVAMTLLQAKATVTGVDTRASEDGFERALEALAKGDFEQLLCFGLSDTGVESPHTLAYGQMIALCNSAAASATRVWCITQQAEQVVEGDTLAGLFDSVMTGVFKVAALEYPAIAGGVVDIGSSDDIGEMLLDSIARGEIDGYNAIRRNRCYKPRLVQLTEVSEQSALQTLGESDGAVLILGGAGGIGYELALQLARNKPRVLALAGREFDSAQKQQRIARLRELGCEVCTFAVDAADSEQVRQMFEQLKSDGIVIRHIVHSAGVGGDKALADIGSDDGQDIVRSKLDAAWHLHRFSEGLPLEHFIVVSTMVGLWGVKHKAHYVLANHFVDRLIHRRRVGGLPGQVVQFGPVDSGMLGEQGKQDAALIGAGAFEVDDAVARMVEASGRSWPEYALLDMDWYTFKDAYARTWIKDYFAEVGLQGEQGDDEVSARQSLFVQDYLHLPQHKRERFVYDAVCEVLKAVLGESQLPAGVGQIGFSDLGVDSILTLSFARQLSEFTGIEVSSIDIFDNATTTELAEFVIAQMPEQEVEEAAPVHAETVAEKADEPAVNQPQTADVLEQELAALEDLLGF